MKTKPIKRHRALQGVSREHHHGLLLGWKIRTGISKDIEIERIKRYADWFYEAHLIPHFKLEENYIFPILGTENELVKKALREHRRLTGLFNENDATEKSLSMIEEELTKHIRFEERVIFMEIQKVVTEKQLKIILKQHNNEKFNDNTNDPFWE